MPGEYRRRLAASKTYETLSAYTLATGYVLVAIGGIRFIGILVITLGVLLLIAAARCMSGND